MIKKKKTKKVKKPRKTKISKKLENYLKKIDIKHNVLEHKTVYTAIDAAITMKRKFQEVVKNLLVKADKDYFLILLPADQNLDFQKTQKAIEKILGRKIKTIKIPSEKMIEKTFKIKAGALSSFGSLYKLPVLMERKISKIKKAVFPSGSFNHSIEMEVKDFIEQEKAKLALLGTKKKIKKRK